MPGFICRCAEKAKELGFDLIGIQFYGKRLEISLGSIIHLNFAMKRGRRDAVRVYFDLDSSFACYFIFILYAVEE